jgi:hypothetical protein
MVVVAYWDWNAERGLLVEVGAGVWFVPSVLDADFAAWTDEICDVEAAAGPDGVANSPTVAKTVDAHTKESAKERRCLIGARRMLPRQFAIDLSIVTTQSFERKPLRKCFRLQYESQAYKKEDAQPLKSAQNLKNSSILRVSRLRALIIWLRVSEGDDGEVQASVAGGWVNS